MITRHEKQVLTTKFMVEHPKSFVHNAPGTGKTIATFDAISEIEGKALVLAPLSILQPAWVEDANKVGMSCNIAHGTPKKREKVLESQSQVVVSNHDAVNWMVKNPDLIKDRKILVIDEYGAFKHRTSMRSKALKKLIDNFDTIWLLNGTPGSQTLCDLWFPAMLLDKGARLGPAFCYYRNQVCEAIPTGPGGQYIEWKDKPSMIANVADKLKDITIRFTLDECTDIPENIISKKLLVMPAYIKEAWEQLQEQSVLAMDTGQIVTAIHAGARAKKILQVLSGAVYDMAGNVARIHSDRAAYVIGLVEEREQCVVAYNYNHELEELRLYAETLNLPYGIINGAASTFTRNKAVEEFQAGKLRILFCHPLSASHGLTLTAGTTTIWTSPIYDVDRFIQLNHRIYRNGQKRKTETILVAYKDSPEEKVYENLLAGVDNLNSLLNYMVQFRTV